MMRSKYFYEPLDKKKELILTVLFVFNNAYLSIVLRYRADERFLIHIQS